VFVSTPAFRALETYRQTQIQSRTPLELVVMLYDGALRHAAAAREALERNDIVARREALSKVLAIVGELQSSLDMERGGEVAQSLDRLYAYVTERFMAASFQRDPALIQQAITVLETLREGWATIATPGGQAAPPTK
jgi:flagellar secretion chaperone FliS